MALEKKNGPKPTTVPVTELPTELVPEVPPGLAKIDPAINQWRNQINDNWRRAVASLGRTARDAVLDEEP